jgi:hypothetical protein
VRPTPSTFTTASSPSTADMSTPSQSPHAGMKRLPSEGVGGIAQLSYAYDAEAQKSEDPSMNENDDSLRMRWARIRMSIREPVAEFFGTMLLCIFGCGVNAQVTLSHNAGVSGAPTGVRALIAQPTVTVGTYGLYRTGSRSALDGRAALPSASGCARASLVGTSTRRYVSVPFTCIRSLY